MKIGQPQGMLLQEFGDVISKAFGTRSVYHVGSSLLAKETWRDVDVRVMLTDDEWERMGFLEPKSIHYDAKWQTLCIVFSHYGRHLTGLPIDFQIQRAKEANEEFKSSRSHLGTYYLVKEQPTVEAQGREGELFDLKERMDELSKGESKAFMDAIYKPGNSNPNQAAVASHSSGAGNAIEQLKQWLQEQKDDMIKRYMNEPDEDGKATWTNEHMAYSIVLSKVKSLTESSLVEKGEGKT